MSKAARKVPILNYIKFLFKVLLYTGLIHLRYNESEKKFKSFLCNKILSQIIYRTLIVVYGVIVWTSLGGLIGIYVRFLDSDFHTKMGPELIQEKMLQVSQVYFRLLMTYVFAKNFVKRSHCLLGIVNCMLRIYNRLTPDTGPEIYVDSWVMILLIMKTYIMVVHVREDWRTLLPASVILREALLPYSYLLCLSMGWTYICFQLVLICFYQKMSEFLKKPRNWRRDCDVSRRVRKFMTISNRIHRVKKQLDCFYTPLFIISCIGLSSDVFHAYSTLKALLFFSKSFSVYVAMILFIIESPLAVVFAFDVFLFGRLSDILCASEKLFKRRLFRVINERGLSGQKHVDRAVELMLTQNLLRGSHTLAFEDMEISTQFAFAYFLTMLITNVITCLQYYASKVVYVANRNESMF